MRAMTDAALPSTARTEASTHVVDQLIEERAQELIARPALWATVKAVFYPALQYGKAVRVADELAPKSGVEAMDWASGFLDMSADVHGLDHVPASGAAVVVANHPGGIADGIAVWDALRERRPDVCFFANRDALRVSPGLQDVVIPVEWREDERSRAKTRETLRLTLDAFKAGRLVVVFPAGRMAKWSWRSGALVERAWLPTAVSLAKKFEAPVVPLGVAQRLSLVYYTLAHVSEELKNMTVFHELLAKRGARYRLRFASPIASHHLPEDEIAATEHLRAFCQELAWDRE